MSIYRSIQVNMNYHKTEFLLPSSRAFASKQFARVHVRAPNKRVA